MKQVMLFILGTGLTLSAFAGTKTVTCNMTDSAAPAKEAYDSKPLGADSIRLETHGFVCRVTPDENGQILIIEISDKNTLSGWPLVKITGGLSEKTQYTRSHLSADLPGVIYCGCVVD
jgi:hypothetical protein